jgi:hypothetical protein
MYDIRNFYNDWRKNINTNQLNYLAKSMRTMIKQKIRVSGI